MEPFVPEREDSRGGSRNQPTPRARGGSKNNALGKPLLIGLVVIVAILAAMVVLQRLSLSSLQAQFDELNSKISSTDESLNQSGAALSIRIQNQADKVKSHGDSIDLNFAEIDKLWAARKKINDSLSGLETQLAEVDKSLSGIDRKISSNVKSAADKMQGDVNNLRQELLSLKLGIDGMETQSASAISKAASVENQMKQSVARTDQRLAEINEQLRAIDSFRQYMSTEVTALKAGQGTSSGNGGFYGGSAVSQADIDQIRREIKLLKEQHPYLQSN